MRRIEKGNDDDSSEVIGYRKCSKEYLEADRNPLAEYRKDSE